MRRAVSVLEVADPSVWEELEARAPLADHLGEVLSPTRRIALPSFERELVPKLAASGLEVLLRWARRPPEEEEASHEALARIIAGLNFETRSLLRAAQHHATDGIVIAAWAWDPVADAPAVRALLGSSLMEAVNDDGPGGTFRLNPDLPPPPPQVYDFAEALMPETADLEPPRSSPLALLHDLASLAAAIEHVSPRRTHAGTLARADGRRLATRLGADPETVLESDERWGRALRGLEALRVVSMDPLQRDLHLDLGLEATLSGEAPEALDHLAHRLTEPDLHGVIPAIREALRQAGTEAIDELIFFELLRAQHRDLILCAWRRGGVYTYPLIEGETPRLYDDAGWDAVETPMIKGLLNRLSRLGLVRRAPGVFAATPDGRVWAGVSAVSAPPIWVSSDLEIVVPPHAVTPWERFQLERLGRCLSRDVVDRYRIERKGLETWLSTHEIEEAIGLLQRRCPGLPGSVPDTLRAFARSAMRVVLVRGVVIDR